MSDYAFSERLASFLRRQDKVAAVRSKVGRIIGGDALDIAPKADPKAKDAANKKPKPKPKPKAGGAAKAKAKDAAPAADPFAEIRKERDAARARFNKARTEADEVQKKFDTATANKLRFTENLLEKTRRALADLRKSTEKMRFNDKLLRHTQQKYWALRREAAPTMALGELIEEALNTSDIETFLIQTTRLQLRQRRNGRMRSLAFALRDRVNPTLGTLCLLEVATAEHLEKFALQLCGQLDDDVLARHGIRGACFALSQEDDPTHAARLAHIIGLFADGGAEGADWTDCQAAMRAALAMRDPALYRRVRSAAAVAGTLTQGPAHKRLEFDRAALMLETAAATTPAKTKAISVGLMSYANIDYSSKNIGDYVQSIAINRTIAGFDFAGGTEGDAADTMAFLQDTARPKTPSAGTVTKPVRFVEVGRDWTSLHAKDPNTIWLVSFGWHMHRQGLARYDYPPPANIRPIFISVHIARPDLLTPEVVEFYKTYGPVGCRDWNTVRLLRAYGVDTFFSGCATTIIGKHYRATPTAGAADLYADYAASARRPEKFKAYEPVDHNDTDLMSRSYLTCIQRADALLRRYETAGQVATPLLHACLPNRAMGNTVEFTHEKPADPRFEGLIDASPAQIDEMADGIASKLEAVMAKIFAGASEKAVYAEWRAVCADAVAATEAALDEATHAARYASYRNAPLPETVPPQILRNGKVLKTGKAGADAAHFAFSFDAGYLRHTAATIGNLVDVTTGEIALHLFTRDIPIDHVIRLSASVPKVTIYAYDMSEVNYGDVRLLPHISISTMDRLLIPAMITGTDRVVYLDADIAIRKDARALWETDLGDHAVAARQSIHKEWRHGTALSTTIAARMSPKLAAQLRAELYAGGPIDFVAYNAGIMVMDVAKLKADGFSAMMLEMVRIYGFHDQIAVNIYTRDKYCVLAPAWNHFLSQEIIDDPAIVHYIGPIKPWHAPNLPFDEVWTQAATRLTDPELAKQD